MGVVQRRRRVEAAHLHHLVCFNSDFQVIMLPIWILTIAAFSSVSAGFSAHKIEERSVQWDPALLVEVDQFNNDYIDTTAACFKLVMGQNYRQLRRRSIPGRHSTGPEMRPRRRRHHRTVEHR